MDDTSVAIARGTRAFRRANAALFLSAFSVFALLYSVQPLLPAMAEEYGLTAGASALALSVSTGVLAVALLLASWAADRAGRKVLMLAAMASSAALALLVPLMADWGALVAVRALLGLTLSGIPAVAMVYLAEEMEPDALGPAMGLYIAGTAIGGMSGRLIVGLVADALGWRAGLGAIGAVALAATVAFWALLPPPRHSARRPVGFGEFARAVRGHLRDKGLVLLFFEAFLLMGAFVTLYNYTGFRLMAPPYGLSQAAISLIFTVYLVGSVASAWIGALAGRLGFRMLFWAMIAVMLVGLGITWFSGVVAVVGGLAVMTFGFFGAHAIASAWVARRAQGGRAQASALYLFFYYLGSSVLGTLGGVAWTSAGWTGILVFTGAVLALGLALAVALVFVPPLPGRREVAVVPPPTS